MLHRYRNIPAVDVVRHLLPDVVVFLTALVTLCVSAWVVTLHKRKEGREEGEEEGRGEGGRRRGGSENVQDGAEQQQMENGGEGDTGQGVGESGCGEEVYVVLHHQWRC